MEKKKNAAYNPHVLGILLVLTESLFFSLMTLFVRLSGDLPTMQKTFFRNAIAAVIAIIILARTPEKFHIQKGSLPDLLKRSIFGTTGMILNFWAIDHISLADANILNKMSPFFAIIVSAVILSEIPDKVEIFSVAVAFAGAAFVVKPTAGIASLPGLIGLLSGFCAGTAYTYVRKLGGKGERGPVIIAFFSVFSCLVCTPSTVLHFAPMTAAQLACLLGAGGSAAVAQFAITRAYKLAPAKEISVFDYSQVLFASVWGALFFSELPDGWSLLGYVLIIGMAVYKWHYNVHVQPEKHSADSRKVS